MEAQNDVHFTAAHRPSWWQSVQGFCKERKSVCEESISKKQIRHATNAARWKLNYNVPPLLFTELLQPFFAQGSHYLFTTKKLYANGQITLDLSRIPINNVAETRSGWTKVQQMYENIHPNLAVVLLFERTEVKFGKGLLTSMSAFFNIQTGQRRHHAEHNLTFSNI